MPPQSKMSPESLEMEPLREKLLQRTSIDDSLSCDTDNENEDEEDILVHGSDDDPSNEDRQLLNEEEERQILLTKKRNKVLIGNGKRSRRRSIESYMENGTLNIRDKPQRFVVRLPQSSFLMDTLLTWDMQKRRCTVKRILCCHVIVLGLIVLCAGIALIVRVFSRPARTHRENTVEIKSNGTHLFQPTVLIISLDGFRPDYIDIGVTPNLQYLRETGVAPVYMKPSFPSLTFPNHYTLVTGLYPESHGVVANTFYDPVLKEEFDIGIPAQSLPTKWWEGTSGGLVEPIWVTAERQGVISATHMWPGSESIIHGQQPTYVDKFNKFEALPKKVDRILTWLDLDDSERPAFIAAYVPNIDTVGHHYGPESPELNLSLIEVDTMIGSVMAGLDQRNLTDIVNLIIVSDHGMASTSKSRLVYLDKLLDLNTIEHSDCWPLKGLRLKASENITALYDHLKSLSADQPWNVYLRDVDMPPRWHFSATYRIAPLFLVPDLGWVILNSKAEFDPEEDEDYYPKGIHGYDNDEELMRSLFLGRGPALKYDYPVKSFENVEVYGIMTNILGITGNPNNGTFIKGEMQRLPTPPKPTAPLSSLPATPTSSADDDGIPEMTPEDWKEIEEDIAEAEEEGRPLTWKEYLELKAEEMKEEIAVWWDWLKHGGGHGR